MLNDSLLPRKRQINLNHDLFCPKLGRNNDHVILNIYAQMNKVNLCTFWTKELFPALSVKLKESIFHPRQEHFEGHDRLGVCGTPCVEKQFVNAL